MDNQEKLKTLRLSADTVGELSDLVGRKKRAGKRATVKDEAERAIAKHLKGEWRKWGSSHVDKQKILRHKQYCCPRTE